MKHTIHHTFDVDLATKIGNVNVSILIHHFQFWIKHNKALGRNEHLGRTWVYQTVKEICAFFPYWSPRQVENIIQKAVNFKILIKGNFNRSKFDRTVWYAFENEEMFTISPNGEMQKTKRLNANNQMVEPIPDSKEDSKEDKNTYAPPKGSATENISSPSILSDAVRSKLLTPKTKKTFSPATLISRLPTHPSEEEFKKHFKVPIVATSDVHHEALVKKHGEEKVTQAYNHLAEWKLSKAQSEPNAVLKHADYYRINKWVMKEILDSYPGGSRKYQRRGKLAISGDQRAMQERRPSVSAEITDEAQKKRINEGYEKLVKDAQDEELKKRSGV